MGDLKRQCVTASRSDRFAKTERKSSKDCIVKYIISCIAAREIRERYNESYLYFVNIKFVLINKKNKRTIRLRYKNYLKYIYVAKIQVSIVSKYFFFVKSITRSLKSSHIIRSLKTFSLTKKTNFFEKYGKFYYDKKIKYYRFFNKIDEKQKFSFLNL